MKFLREAGYYEAVQLWQDFDDPNAGRPKLLEEVSFQYGPCEP